MNILVTDGENRSCLAVTRSLGRRGDRVFVSGLKSQNISSCSKYCIKGFAVTNPLRESYSYVKDIMEIVREKKIDIIIPMTEQTIGRLNNNRKAFPSKTIFACPTQDKINRIINKICLNRLAEKLNIPTPRTCYIDTLKKHIVL